MRKFNQSVNMRRHCQAGKFSYPCLLFSDTQPVICLDPPHEFNDREIFSISFHCFVRTKDLYSVYSIGQSFLYFSFENPMNQRCPHFFFHVSRSSVPHFALLTFTLKLKNFIPSYFQFEDAKSLLTLYHLCRGLAPDIFHLFKTLLDAHNNHLFKLSQSPISFHT